MKKREKEDSGVKERRGEGRHDISLACADSSSFVTVAAINNSGVLSLWIIRVGLRWAVARVAHVYYRGGIPFNSVQFRGGGGDEGETTPPTTTTTTRTRRTPCGICDGLEGHVVKGMSLTSVRHGARTQPASILISQ